MSYVTLLTTVEANDQSAHNKHLIAGGQFTEAHQPCCQQPDHRVGQHAAFPENHKRKGSLQNNPGLINESPIKIKPMDQKSVLLYIFQWVFFIFSVIVL